MGQDFISQSAELPLAAAQQVLAQDTSHSIWVAASAGAGKTRVLTARILRLLIEGVDPAGILALTYTRAAAKEMESRVIAQARDLALASAANRTKAVKDLLSLTDEDASAPELLTRAQSLYERILETPGGMQIQTIHAFCQSLLGRFPFEAGLTPGFQAVEDEERAEILAQAVSRTLESGASFQTLQAASRPDSLLDLAAALVRVDWEKVSAKDRLRAFDQALGGGFSGGLVHQIEVGFEAELTSRRPLMESLGAQADASSGDSDQKLATALSTAFEGEGALEVLSRHFMTDGRLKKTRIHTKALAGHPGIDWLKELLPEVTARLQAQRLYDLNADVLAFGQQVSSAFAEEKRRRAALDFDDLIEDAQRLFARHNGPTYVQYRLDQRISHILVDEAQDTSAAQWQIVAGLADPFFDDASQMIDRQRTLFVVGDFKQSIYSFQGAKPQLFAEQRRHFGDLAQEGLRPVDMVHSFRSAPAILSFVDAVAERGEGLRLETAEMLRHRAVQQDRAGRVEVWPVPDEPPQRLTPGWEPPREPQGEDQRRAALGQLIAAQIDRLCNDPTWAHRPEAQLSLGRRVQPGDFLVLVQNRRPVFANALIGALKARGIPVTGVDRLKVAEELVVRDLLALGEVCLQPGDDLSLAALLKSPICGYDESRLFDLAHGRGEVSLWEHLRTFDPSLFERLQALAGRVGRVSVYEFFANFLFAEGGRSRILAGSGSEADEVLSLFLDAARAHDLDHNGDLLGFIEAQRGSPRELKRDTSEALGEVRLMTIHGAKGLEAPIVILPDMSDPSRGGGARLSDQMVEVPEIGPLWVPSKDFDLAETKGAKDARKAAAMAERERLFYVALTRAEERLIICTDLQREDKPEQGISTWYNRARTVAAERGEEQDFELEAIGWPLSKGFAYGSLPQVLEGRSDGQSRPPAAPLPAWAKQILHDQEPSPEKPLSPSLLLEAAVPDAPVLAPSARSQALQRGTLIHAALEHLPSAGSENWPERLARFFALKAPGVSEGEREAWIAETLAALANPPLQAFFGPDSQAEVNVSGQIDGRSYVGQIDRLYVDPVAQVVHILDYKTNCPPPRRAEDVSPAYLLQLQAYAQLIAPLYPGFEVRTALFWTHTCHLMDVTAL